jgi:hypothetical protein
MTKLYLKSEKKIKCKMPHLNYRLKPQNILSRPLLKWSNPKGFSILTLKPIHPILIFGIRAYHNIPNQIIYFKSYIIPLLQIALSNSFSKYFDLGEFLRRVIIFILLLKKLVFLFYFIFIINLYFSF